jgi:hypothetical protein
MPEGDLPQYHRVRATRRVPLLEQELLTIPKHLSSPPGFSGVRVSRSIVFWVLSCRSLFVLLLLVIVLSVLLWFMDSDYLPLVSSNSSYIEQRTNNDLQDNTQKTIDRETRTPLKPGGELRCFGMVSSSCFNSGTRRVALTRWYWGKSPSGIGDHSRLSLSCLGPLVY